MAGSFNDLGRRGYRFTDPQLPENSRRFFHALWQVV
jgi:hypothetical protein